MKVGRSLDRTNLFDKSVDTADDITEGATKLFYPSGDAVKVDHLPGGAISYLEIIEYDTNPGTGLEGEVIYNTTDNKHYLWEDSEWVEVLFSMQKVVP